LRNEDSWGGQDTCVQELLFLCGPTKDRELPYTAVDHPELFLPTTEGGIRMSAIATSTLFVVVILTAMLLAWWRTILKVLAVTVLVLTSIGMAEVVATLVSGFTPN